MRFSVVQKENNEMWTQGCTQGNYNTTVKAGIRMVLWHVRKGNITRDFKKLKLLLLLSPKMNPSVLKLS